MNTLGMVILVGMGVGVGLTLVIVGLTPARVRLADLADRPVDIPATSGSSVSKAALSMLHRLHVSTPSRELRLVGRTADEFLLQRAMFAGAGLVYAPVMSRVFALIGIAPPIPLTAALSLVTAAIGWWIPGRLLASKAEAARAEFRTGLTSYLDLVALGRRADQGVVAALRTPTEIGSGWVFARLRSALDDADRRNEMPWEGLRRAAVEMGIRELDDIGTIATAAGESGAQIGQTLEAKAASLRDQLLTDEMGSAAVRADRMNIPVTLMGMGFIAFLTIPGVMAIAGS